MLWIVWVILMLCPNPPPLSPFRQAFIDGSVVEADATMNVGLSAIWVCLCLMGDTSSTKAREVIESGPTPSRSHRIGWIRKHRRCQKAREAYESRTRGVSRIHHHARSYSLSHDSIAHEPDLVLARSTISSTCTIERRPKSKCCKGRARGTSVAEFGNCGSRILFLHSQIAPSHFQRQG